MTRLRIEHANVIPGESMTCFLPPTKGDRQHAGTTFKAPALSRLCPVAAYSAWIDLAGLIEGHVFRSIDRWGRIGDERLHINSLVPLLRSLFDQASIASALEYSGHSLRRGFANWAIASGWDLKTLMEYVCWKSIHSAMRYLDGDDPFAEHRIEKPSISKLSST